MIVQHPRRFPHREELRPLSKINNLPVMRKPLWKWILSPIRTSDDYSLGLRPDDNLIKDFKSELSCFTGSKFLTQKTFKKCGFKLHFKKIVLFNNR